MNTASVHKNQWFGVQYRKMHIFIMLCLPAHDMVFHLFVNANCFENATSQRYEDHIKLLSILVEIHTSMNCVCKLSEYVSFSSSCGSTLFFFLYLVYQRHRVEFLEDLIFIIRPLKVQIRYSHPEVHVAYSVVVHVSRLYSIVLCQYDRTWLILLVNVKPVKPNAASLKIE